MFERRNSKYPLQVNVDLWADVGRASTQMLPDYEQWRLGRGRRSATVLTDIKDSPPQLPRLSLSTRWL